MLIKGKLPAVWEAKWIDPEHTRPATGQRNLASYLRKNFTAPDSGDVFLYAAAHGIYDIWINGIHVDGFLFAPGNSQYNKRLMAQCYDVTEMVHSGENELLVTIGDGWYRGCVGNGMDSNTFGNDIAFLCQLEAGGNILLGTDESWTASQDGALGYNDLMRGEEYDACKHIGHWHSVSVCEYKYENVIPTDCPPIVEHEHFPAKLFTTPVGEKVLDFGQNFAGYVEFRFDHVAAGRKIVLTHGETLNEEGNFTIANFQNPAKPECFQRITYICRDGENRYRPTKCYFGFRYVKVEAEFPVTEDMFTGIAVYSDMREICTFRCGSGLVNRLFQNVCWSMKSNFVGLPTDCPTREKSGFTGDAQIFCDTAITLMDSYPVLDNWLGDVAAAAGNGIFRQVAPDGRKPGYFENSPGWCDAIELVPWRMWKRSGDTAYIERHYGAMKDWLDFCIERAKQTRPENQGCLRPDLMDYFADAGFCWGEWLEPGADTRAETMAHMMHGEPEVATAYLSYGCRAMSEMAQAIGRTEDAEYYGSVAEKAKEAYREAFLPIHSTRQCCYVRPIFMSLLTEEEKIEAAGKLAVLISQNSSHLNTGFLSTGELCRVLTDYGQTKTAYDLLLQESCPSWLYPVTKGATTVWERWEGIDEQGKPTDSLNHYAYGAVAAWLIDSVCGIRVEQGKIIIAPHPDKRLCFAEAAYDSPLGVIRAAWRYEGDRIVFEGLVPEGCKAEFVFPDKMKYCVMGKYSAAYGEDGCQNLCNMTDGFSIVN